MRTSLFNSLLMHWSFESKEIVEKGVLELAAINLSGLMNAYKNCQEEDRTCLTVEYPLYLDIHLKNEIERIEIRGEGELAAFLGAIDEELIVRLGFPLKVSTCCGKVEHLYSEKEFLVILSNSLNCSTEEAIEFKPLQKENTGQEKNPVPYIFS